MHVVRATHACHVLVTSSSKFASNCKFRRLYRLHQLGVALASLNPQSGLDAVAPASSVVLVLFEFVHLVALRLFPTFNMAVPYKYEARDVKFLAQETAADMDTVGGMFSEFC
jgi:hypothetical protein